MTWSLGWGVRSRNETQGEADEEKKQKTGRLVPN